MEFNFTTCYYMFVCLKFFVLLENFSLSWRRHNCRWRSAKKLKHYNFKRKLGKWCSHAQPRHGKSAPHHKTDLNVHGVCEAMPHISLTSEELDPSLMEITTRAENLRRRYFHRNLFGNDDQFCEPVFVTKKKRTERNLISNKSKSETYDIISIYISLITVW